ncbi:sugar phosphate/phosphate translocator like protein [Verticillium longisporum]|uniref:Sugar phosphate/phosphate translocator like protein n=1 Tax=Verticillium longisporum TaxID=100787 RepID=A0A8I2ZKZ6_VERLO|nr:sugar phosphate/phosphate translocator like protein [Verticillium longisporum]
MGVADPTMTAIVNVLCIVAGVGLASAGEVDMSMVGTVIQLAGIMFEALRVVLIQKMLSNEGLKMDALVGLYYYAPVCAVMNLVVGAALEMPHFKYEDLERAGFMMLILNAAVALLLNFTSMVLIGKTSGLVTTLTGIFKNILLIGCSVLFWHTKISTIQVVGYSVSLAGLIHYSFGTEKILGALKGALAMVTGAFGAASVSGEKFRPSRRMRIGLVIAFITVLSICIFLAYMRHIEASPLEWVWSTTGGTV